MFVDNKSGIKFVTSSTLYYACNMGQKARCLYALCDECYQSKYPANKRRGTSEDKKEEKSPMEKARHTCCHGKQDLRIRSDLWWCDPEYLGTETWFSRVHACFGCRKAFVQVPAKNLLPNPLENFKMPPVSKYHNNVQAEYKKHKSLIGENLFEEIDGERSGISLISERGFV